MASETQLSPLESFSLTAQWTEKPAALNHSEYDTVGPLAARILASASTSATPPPPPPPLPPKRLMRNLTAMTRREAAIIQFLDDIKEACKTSPPQLRKKDQRILELDDLDKLQKHWAEIECFLEQSSKPVDTTSHGKVDLMNKNVMSLDAESWKISEVYYRFFQEQLDIKIKAMSSDRRTSLQDNVEIIKKKMASISRNTQGLYIQGMDFY